MSILDKVDAKQQSTFGFAPFCVGLLRYFEATRRLKKRSLLCVNEHFKLKVDAKQQSTFGFAPFCVGLLGYFEATRRLKKRSLLEVNKHFSDKVDAKIANKTMQNL